MVEEKKNNQGAKDECCSTSGGSSDCCGGKKFFVGLLAGVILAAVAFGFFTAGQCAAKGKICPVMQMQSQK